MKHQTVYPLELHLACGTARAVPQRTQANGAPLYAIAGVARPDIDPTIPLDLAAAGWHWAGSWLVCGDRAIAARGCLSEVWAAARLVERG